LVKSVKGRGKGRFPTHTRNLGLRPPDVLTRENLSRVREEREIHSKKRKEEGAAKEDGQEKKTPASIARGKSFVSGKGQGRHPGVRNETRELRRYLGQMHKKKDGFAYSSGKRGKNASATLTDQKAPLFGGGSHARPRKDL